MSTEPKRYSIEAAAIAGFVFAALYAPIHLIALRIPDRQSGDFVAWANDAGNRTLVVIAFNVAALASIAFLWFVVVLRKRLADSDHPLLSTIFDASAVLFIALALVGLALRVAPIIAMGEAALDAADIAVSGSGADLILIVALPRMQALFVISTSTIGRKFGALPSWLVYAGYLFGAVLIAVPLVLEVSGMGFGLWVALVSASLLIRRKELESTVTGSQE
jgi:hypothetical protein